MGALKVYDVVVDGIRTSMKLTEAEAQRRGLTGPTATAASTKKRTARNKAVPSPEPAAPERPAGNASTETWAVYAKAVGVDVPDDASRADIIAAVDAD